MNFILKILIALHIISEPTADKALGDLNKAIVKLENAVEHQCAKAEAAVAAAAAATKAATDATAEVDRAKRVKAKLTDLFA